MSREVAQIFFTEETISRIGEQSVIAEDILQSERRIKGGKWVPLEYHGTHPGDV